MRALFGMELRKAIRNPWFIIAVAISSALAVVSAVGNILYYQRYGVFELYAHKYVSPVPGSCFKWWISLDFLQPASTLLFQLLPLLAVIPYAWSFRTEMQSGYLNQVATRTTRKRYLAAKSAVVFLTGSLIAAVPLILNIFMLACFIPAYLPDITEVLYLGVYTSDLWSWFFYNAPVAYVFLYTLLASCMCGFWALLVHSLSFAIDNRVALLIAPYLGVLGLQFFSDRIYLALGSINGPQLGLSANMRAGVESYPQVWWAITLEIAVMLTASALLARRQLKEDLL